VNLFFLFKFNWTIICYKPTATEELSPSIKHRPWFGSQISYMTPGKRRWEAPHTCRGPNGRGRPGDSNGRSSYQVKTRTIVRWRWISGSRLQKGLRARRHLKDKRAKLAHLFIRVRRPHLILARWLPKICRAMRTFPSLRRSISELILVKNGCDVVVEILVLRLFFPPNSPRWAPESVGGRWWWVILLFNPFPPPAQSNYFWPSWT
jgi:hypothetical protein